jgi:uncharacterized protein (TIGR02001 family)
MRPADYAGGTKLATKAIRKIAMLTSVRSLMAATVLAGSALLATPAMAQDEETPAVSVTGSVAVVSDYRFRGIGLSGGDPAVQGGLTLNTAPGFYVGTWGSNLDDCGTGFYGELELDLFAGWSGMVTDNVGVDVGVTYYAYPTNDIGPSDVWEFYGKVKPTLGPVGLTLGVAYSPDQDSLGGGDNLYLSADAAVSIPETPVSLSGHIGYTDGFLTYTPSGHAVDYSVGASVTVLGGLSLGVSYVGVEGPTGPLWDGITDDTVVGSISYAF